MFKNIRIVGGKEYHYLEHSFRIGKKVDKISFYTSKDRKFDLNSFLKLNEEMINKIVEKRVKFIKNNLDYDKFYDYGDQLMYIEKSKILFQIFFKKLNQNKQNKIMDNFLRNFIVNSMQMEGGTVSYKVAEAIDMNKKIKFDDVDEKDIPLYKQLREAYKVLEQMRLRSPKQIKDLHRIIYQGTYSFAGNFRKTEVTFGRGDKLARTFSPENVVKGFKIMFEKYNNRRTKMTEFDRIILFHRDYQEVHGFKDGNSRLGRLIMIKQLISAEYPPLVIRGSSSQSYRTTLVKAINDNHNLPLFKFYYEQHKRTFEKFWKPVIEEVINKEFDKL